MNLNMYPYSFPCVNRTFSLMEHPFPLEDEQSSYDALKSAIGVSQGYESRQMDRVCAITATTSPEEIARRVESAVEDLRSFVQGTIGGNGEVKLVVAQTALQIAADRGIDVAELRAQMPELEKAVLRCNAEKEVQNLRRYIQGTIAGDAMEIWNRMSNALQIAAAHDIGIRDLLVQMPEFERAELRRNAENELQNLRWYIQGAIAGDGIEILKRTSNALQAAADCGVDVGELLA